MDEKYTWNYSTCDDNSSVSVLKILRGHIIQKRKTRPAAKAPMKALSPTRRAALTTGGFSVVAVGATGTVSLPGFVGVKWNVVDV